MKVEEGDANQYKCCGGNSSTVIVRFLSAELAEAVPILRFDQSERRQRAEEWPYTAAADDYVAVVAASASGGRCASTAAAETAVAAAAAAAAAECGFPSPKRGVHPLSLEAKCC